MLMFSIRLSSGIHSMSVLAWYLRVNSLKRECRIDLPELTSILTYNGAFDFTCYDDSSELILRSVVGGMK